MIFDKIKYCKCQNCNKKGIESFSKMGYRSNPDVECKYCHKVYKINFFLALLIKIGVPIFWGLLGLFIRQYVFDIPIIILVIPALISFFLLEYFAPLEEKDQNSFLSEIGKIKLYDDDND